jgi:pyrroline-5-carboxylate reductase
MNRSIGFLGLGNMGRAIALGLKKATPERKLYGFDIDFNKSESMKETVIPCMSLNECVTKSDIVILAVKPNTIDSMLTSIQSDSSTVFISVAAGITISRLEKKLGSTSKIIRVMPNTPALIGKGMSVLSINRNISEDDSHEAEELFKAVGKTLVLPEKLMNAVTGVSGCGPAYGYSFIQAMADGGVKMGLSRSDAVLLAAQTLLGAAAMVMETDFDPITLRNMVTSPGGSTIAAVHELETNGVAGAIMDAVEEATIVTERLGQHK